MPPRSRSPGVIEIVNPVAGLRPPEDRLARRLANVSGKRVAIVHSPLAFSRAFAERLGGLLRERYGVAEVVAVQRRHYIMPLTSQQIEALASQASAVVLGVGENRPGTAIHAWDAVEMERRNVPTATLCTQKAAILGKAGTTALGAPGLPVIALPDAATSGPQAAAEAVVDEVAQALTRPVEEIAARYRGLHASHDEVQEALGLSSIARAERLHVEATPEGVHQALADLRCWDGLPVVPPTPERVEAMVRSIARSPGDVVAYVPPRWGVATPQKMAACAVMAGCRPEHLPVLTAAVQTLSVREMNALGVLTGTGPQAPLVLVHGPIRQETGINSGANALGPGVQANATIGRAMRLVLMAIGGSIPGLTDYATLGQAGKYTLCLGENEEESPWQPLHADRGLDRNASAVTVIFLRGNFDVFTVSTRAEAILQTIANGLKANSHGNVFYGGELVVFLGPDFAKRLASAGYSKADCQRYLFERARVRVGDLPPEDIAALRAFRSDEFFDFSPDALVPPARRPEDILLLVAGGHGIHITISPTAGGLSRSQTVPLEAQRPR
ncbi:MAG: hypothetical protein HY684_02185 [Chloroflexi bacterium]|nr:hypothetical protein [Chloroflexota bacterium]